MKYLFLFLALFLGGLSNNIQAQDQSFPEASLLINELDSCYFANGECEDLFEESYQSLKKIENDSIAGRFLLKLGTIRENAGLWDQRTEDLYIEAIQRAQSTENPCIEITPHFAYTRFALFQADPNTTLERAKTSLEIAQSCGNLNHIAHAYSFVGAAYVNMSQYLPALENLQEAERLYSEDQDSLGIAMVLLDKAIVQSELKNRDESIASTKKASEIYKAAGAEMNYAIALIDLCSDYLAHNELDSALKYLPIAKNIVEGKHLLAMAYVNQHYGEAYLKKANFSEALAYFNESQNIVLKIGDSKMEATNDMFLSEIYIALNRPKLAHSYALKADSIAKVYGNTNLRVGTLNALAQSNYAIGNYAASHEAFNRHNILSDSLIGIERQVEIANLEQAYLAEKREGVIRLHEKENALLTLKNNAANNRNIALGISLLLAIAIGYSLYNRQRLKVAKQEALLKEKEHENERLNTEIQYKNKELTSKVLHIAQKNELLGQLNSDLKEIQSKMAGGAEINQLVNKLRVEEQINDNWDQFTGQFTELNPKFYKNLTSAYPDLSKNDLRLAALLRMNLSTKDIARVLNISEDGVKKARHRLRKKIDLQSDQSLETHILSV